MAIASSLPLAEPASSAMGSSPEGSSIGSAAGSSAGSSAGSEAGSEGSSGSVGSSMTAITTEVGCDTVRGAAKAKRARPRASSSDRVESGWITSRTPWSWVAPAGAGARLARVSGIPLQCNEPRTTVRTDARQGSR
ncbi:MAG: hypothetical protein FJ270_05150 [Planctomycetes bacterium]|nr:hypothetical protein [Planctomycetota bacterium]